MKTIIMLLILAVTGLNLKAETLKIKCTEISVEQATRMAPDLMSELGGKTFIPMQMGGIVEINKIEENIFSVEGRMLLVSEAGNRSELEVSGYFSDKGDVMQIAPVDFLHSAIISLDRHMVSTFHFIDIETVGITSCRRW